MAQFDDISDAARRAIVAQAVPMLARHDTEALGAPEQPMILGASLQEEILTLDAIRGDATITPRPTGQTVSLLHMPGEHATLGLGAGREERAFGYVRAGHADDALGAAAPATVTAVSASDLSARIQTAIEWIDRALDRDLLVRVLTVPAYHVTALALHSGDKVVGVVALPTQDDKSFEAQRLYTLDEFVGRLRELPSAQGLTP